MDIEKHAYNLKADLEKGGKKITFEEAYKVVVAMVGFCTIIIERDFNNPNLQLSPVNPPSDSECK